MWGRTKERLSRRRGEAAEETRSAGGGRGAARRRRPAEEFGEVWASAPGAGPARLYSRLISISLPRDPGLGAAPGPPTSAGWCQRAWRCGRQVPHGGRIPGRGWRGLRSQGPGRLEPDSTPGPLLHPGARVCGASASRAGEAIHSCAVPTLRAANERPADRALGLGKKFAEAGGSVGALFISPTR